jgi:hypothetical protein
VCAAFGGSGAFARLRDFALARENADFSRARIIGKNQEKSDSNSSREFPIANSPSRLFPIFPEFPGR